MKATQSGGGEAGKDSAQIKKEMRESVLKSAQEYRQQHRVEVDTSESAEAESTTFHELQNPNDELAVTYLFYELQRTYRISERIRELTPVVLVANDVPAPHEIDDAWLIEHDWILRRTILDDSFRPALDYLTKSFVGAEVNIRILEANAAAQKQIVDRINQQCDSRWASSRRTSRACARRSRDSPAASRSRASFNTVKRIFDPLGITGEADTGAVDAAQTMVDYAKADGRSSRAREGAAAGPAGSRHDGAAGGRGQALSRGQGALRQGRRNRSPARPREGQHPLLHAGDLEAGAAGSAILPAVRHRRARS